MSELSVAILHIPCGQLILTTEELDSHDLHCPERERDEFWHRYVTQPFERRDGDER